MNTGTMALAKQEVFSCLANLLSAICSDVFSIHVQREAKQEEERLRTVSEGMMAESQKNVTASTVKHYKYETLTDDEESANQSFNPINETFSSPLLVCSVDRNCSKRPVHCGTGTDDDMVRLTFHSITEWKRLAVIF